MIGRLRGKLIQKTPPTICIDVNGVGYDCDVPMSTLYQLPELGHEVELYTHLMVREDAHLLFGFAQSSEREAFRTLLKVSGIGARTALAILSGLGVDELQTAVTLGDVARLQKVPGIGKKTAERLLLELRGKFSAQADTSVATAPDARSDIVNALIALGYTEKDAQATLKKLPADLSVEDGIRMALRQLAG